MFQDHSLGTIRRCQRFLVLSFLSLCLPQINAAPGVGSSVAWANRDVGWVGVPGSVVAQEDSLAVRGAGADIWQRADSFFYVFIPWQGDGQFVARAAEVEDIHPWAKAGIMVREDLTETSRQAMIAMTPQQGAAFL